MGIHARFEVVEVKIDNVTGEQKYFFAASCGTYEDALMFVRHLIANESYEALYNIEKCYGSATEKFKNSERIVNPDIELY